MKNFKHIEKEFVEKFKRNKVIELKDDSIIDFSKIKDEINKPVILLYFKLNGNNLYLKNLNFENQRERLFLGYIYSGKIYLDNINSEGLNICIQERNNENIEFEIKKCNKIYFEPLRTKHLKKIILNISSLNLLYLSSNFFEKVDFENSQINVIEFQHKIFLESDNFSEIQFKIEFLDLIEKIKTMNAKKINLELNVPTSFLEENFIGIKNFLKFLKIPYKRQDDEEYLYFDYIFLDLQKSDFLNKISKENIKYLKNYFEMVNFLK